MVTPCEKAHALVSTSDVVGDDGHSLPALIATRARPGAQEQKMVVLTPLASSTKRARFKASSDEASTSMLKVFYELPEQ